MWMFPKSCTKSLILIFWISFTLFYNFFITFPHYSFNFKLFYNDLHLPQLSLSIFSLLNIAITSRIVLISKKGCLSASSAVILHSYFGFNIDNIKLDNGNSILFKDSLNVHLSGLFNKSTKSDNSLECKGNFWKVH